MNGTAQGARTHDRTARRAGRTPTDATKASVRDGQVTPAPEATLVKNLAHLGAHNTSTAWWVLAARGREGS